MHIYSDETQRQITVERVLNREQMVKKSRSSEKYRGCGSTEHMTIDCRSAIAGRALAQDDENPVRRTKWLSRILKRSPRGEEPGN